MYTDNFDIISIIGITRLPLNELAEEFRQNMTN